MIAKFRSLILLIKWMNIIWILLELIIPKLWEMCLSIGHVPIKMFFSKNRAMLSSKIIQICHNQILIRISIYVYTSTYTYICITVLCDIWWSRTRIFCEKCSSRRFFLESAMFSFQFQSLQFRIYVIRVTNGNAE